VDNRGSAFANGVGVNLSSTTPNLAAAAATVAPLETQIIPLQSKTMAALNNVPATVSRATAPRASVPRAPTSMMELVAAAPISEASPVLENNTATVTSIAPVDVEDEIPIIPIRYLRALPAPEPAEVVEVIDDYAAPVAPWRAAQPPNPPPLDALDRERQALIDADKDSEIIWATEAADRAETRRRKR